MFYSIKFNGGEFLKSDLIPFPHAFSTRSGGVSTIPHLASMNVALNRGDEEVNVRENRRILANAAGATEQIVYASQIHSSTVAYVEYGTEIPENGLNLGSLDGIVSADPSLTLLVKTADCAPILLCDSETGIVAAVHAGWRGTAAGIAAEAVRVMAAHGSLPANIRAAIGPCIHACCFEVGEDLREAVIALRGSDFASRHIGESEDTLHADIVAMNCELLLEAGIPLSNIDLCPLCTCCEPNRFHSHRASKGNRGTMGAVISALKIRLN
ncbi:MAG: peptidoglycan editing factor PgeF [Clostridia bacterium]|nr:peptidoglycan editing factor PgeF [Clostridia bacterium]